MEEKRPKVGIGVIVVRDGKVLLGERLASHGAGTWAIPGGHLEFGETFEECAKREVAEETGLTDVVFKDVVALINNRVYDKHFISIGVVVEWVSGEAIEAEPEKSKNWTWFAPEELPENIFIPSKDVLNSWISKKIYNPDIWQ